MKTSKNFFFLIISFFLICSLGMRLSIDNSIFVQESPRDFQNVSKDLGWVIVGNHLFWTSNNGTNWVNISPAPNQTLRTALFLDADIGFAVTSKLNLNETIDFELFITKNNGASWTEKNIITYPLTDPNASVESIKLTFLDAKIGWVFLKRMTSSNFSIGSLFQTIDGGTTWNQVPLPTAGEAYFRDAKTGFAVSGIQDQLLYHTTNQGRDWQIFDPSPSEISSVSRPYFISGSLGEFVALVQQNNGTALKVFSTENSGQDWIEKIQLVISENEWIDAPISAVPGEIKILTPKQLITYWQTAEIFESKDRLSTENISKFQMIDNNHGWALSQQMQCDQPDNPQSCITQSQLLKTQNGGLNWLQIEIPLVQTESTIEPRSQSISPDSAQTLSRTSLHSGQGFDQCEISSLSNLQKWKTNSPYSIVNLYIGGKARACANVNLSPEFIQGLSIQGWKFIPTWVGPQASCTNYSVTMSPNASTAEGQGRDQAIDAARTAMKYGLSEIDQSGTVIYYDLEAFDITNLQCLNAAKAFINGWVEQLHTIGVTAGVYGSVCSSGLKEFSTIANPPDVIWPALWVSDIYTSSVTADDLPCVSNSLWGNHNRIYQYTGAHLETWGNTAMSIDVDVIDGIVADISKVVGVPPSTLDNISFETGTLTPWTIVPNETACEWQIDNTTNAARTGSYYLQLAKTTNQTTCLGVRQSITLTSIVGDTYRFAIWAKSSSPGTYRSLRLGITGLGTISESTSQKFSGIGENWICLEVAHTINQGNLTGIQVQIQSEDSDGIDIYLDDSHLALNTGSICAQSIPPTGLKAGDSAAVDAVVVQWDKVPDSTYYKIYRSAELTSEKIQIGLILDTLYIDQDGGFYDNYYYWVKACNANSCSIFSAPDRGGFASPFLDFFDGFESGTTSMWIDWVNSNKIWACNTNPINGQYHLCVNSNTLTSAYLAHNLPNATNMADVSFKIDPNSASIGAREYILLEARDSILNKTAFRVKFSYINSTYNMKIEGQDNTGKFFSTNWFAIPDSPTTIGLRWNSTIGHLRAASPLGGFSLLINGIVKAQLTGILNNQLKVDKLTFGAMVSQADPGASGQFYLDDFSFDGPLFIRSQKP